MDVSPRCGLPRIPGASVTLQRRETGSPIGEATYFETFLDGELISHTLGSVKEPDVSVTMSYEKSLKWRIGDIDLLSSIKGAEVHGRRSHLMLLFGLLESSEYRDYVSPHSTEIGQLIALSRHYGAPDWRRAQRDLCSDLISESAN
jgi:hypothetical protein